MAEGQTLYHYTNLAAAMGIVQNMEMWATDYRYLNDSGELHHALKVFLDYAGDDKAIFAKHLNLFLSSSAVCVISLSEQPDTLSQWRAYSNDGKGVSLGLDTSFNKELAPKKCFYDSDLFLDEHFSSMSADLRKLDLDLINDQSGNYECQYIFDFYRDRFNDFANVVSKLMLMKNPAFREENEWRIIRVLDPHSDQLNWRLAQNGDLISPYKKISLYPDIIMEDKKDFQKCKELVIREIWGGPKYDRRNDMFFKSSMYGSFGPKFKYFDCGYQ